MSPRPIDDVASSLGIDDADLVPMGRGKAKVALEALARATPRARGKLVLVSALTPTSGGEGKTTVSVGLAMGLAKLGQKAVVCLREPSLGPVFGSKGGGTGGGRAQVVPAADINLHFTGDLHAVSSAHNLLAALVDASLHFEQRLDPRRVGWPRVVDMNDRALRHVVVGLGGPSDGVPRESRFDITAASEVMAVLCLSRSRADLRSRLGRIVVGRAREGGPVTAEDLGAVGAMEALLAEALAPNLVQTTEGTPAIVHGGPFANIAHGCSSVLGTELGLLHSDYAVTEAGFGFDLGGEKFLHLVSPRLGVAPAVVVLVATVRALARHGGDPVHRAVPSVTRGFAQLDHHAASVRAFGLRPVVALNVFPGDPEESLVAVERHAAAAGLPIARVTAFADGGDGAVGLAARVVEVAATTAVRPLYAPDEPYLEKLRAVARRLYGASDVVLSDEARRDLERFASWGHGALPPCVAKTPLSLTDDPHRAGVPEPFVLHVTSLRLSAGAGFIVALCGDVSTMPGLPRDPAARHVRVHDDGTITGLMQGEG